ncbi:MAG TPA: mechanosensitive ion channel domain-containing protein, partial [Candidatus Limnocylindria bacterium]|nr:mechanosensitive ion channel domain-containing protein [Candidatus Limnocylindria bacterium]
MTTAQTAWSEWVDRTGESVAGLLGPWVNEEVFLGVRAMTVVAALLVMALSGGADAVLRAVIRHRVRHDEAVAPGVAPHEREARYWVDLGLQAAVPPLALLLWVQGVAAGLSIVLLDLRAREQADVLFNAVTAARGAGTLVGLFWLLYRLSRVLEARLAAMSARTGSTWDRVLIPLAGKMVRLTLPLVAVILGVPALPVSPGLQGLLQNGVSLLIIGAVAVVLFQLVQAAEALVLAQYRLDVSDNLEARKVYTQVTVLRKVAMVIIGIFTLASMLMVFDSVRQFGTSILASAGIAGIIIGFAAQRSIATLLAGFQLALTQPIRLDDVVIVENEWGRIEDITLTYVIVRIWDMRRLIVPITYFIERPFQ